MNKTYLAIVSIALLAVIMMGLAAPIRTPGPPSSSPTFSSLTPLISTTTHHTKFTTTTTASMYTATTIYTETSTAIATRVTSTTNTSWIPPLGNYAFGLEGNVTIFEPMMPEPSDLWEFVKPVSFDEYLEILRNQSLTVYLPTYLPRGLKPVAVWTEDEGGYALIAYANESVDNYGFAPMGIEVSRAVGESEYEDVREICMYIAEWYHNATLIMGRDMVFVIMPWLRGAGTHQYHEKFGLYMHLAIGWKSDWYYIIGVAPSYATPEELQLIILSMEPVP